MDDFGEITALLKAWGSGDQGALKRLADRVYGELRAMARRHMRNERSEHTLQTTALVHEVYLRLVDATQVNWRDRAQFFAISAQMMRRILVDAARGRRAQKRGGAAVKVNLDETAQLSPGARARSAKSPDSCASQLRHGGSKCSETRF